MDIGSAEGSSPLDEIDRGSRLTRCPIMWTTRVVRRLGEFSGLCGGLTRTHDQNGAGGLSQDAFSDTSQDQVRYATAPTGSHNHQVDAVLLGILADLNVGQACAHFAVNGARNFSLWLEALLH